MSDERALNTATFAPPRDLCDIASAATDVALDIKWAGKRLYAAFEAELFSPKQRADVLRELYQARADLNRLIGEIEARAEGGAGVMDTKSVKRLKINDRVQFVSDQVCGTVSEIGYSAAKIRWDDGQTSILHFDEKTEWERIERAP